MKHQGPAQRRQRARGARAGRGARAAAGGDARGAAELRRASRTARSGSPTSAACTYVDDSKGTNVGATLAAVAGMAGPLVMIAGGEGKNQDFAPLRAAFRGKVRCAVLIGRDAAALEQVLGGVCPIAQRHHAAGGGARPRRRRRSPVTPCCCRPRAPASTCSATMRTAARCSRKRCGSWPHERHDAHSWDLRAPARATAPCTSMG